MLKRLKLVKIIVMSVNWVNALNALISILFIRETVCSPVQPDKFKLKFQVRATFAYQIQFRTIAHFDHFAMQVVFNVPVKTVFYVQQVTFFMYRLCLPHASSRHHLWLALATTLMIFSGKFVTSTMFKD